MKDFRRAQTLNCCSYTDILLFLSKTSRTVTSSISVVKQCYVVLCYLTYQLRVVSMSFLVVALRQIYFTSSYSQDEGGQVIV